MPATPRCCKPPDRHVAVLTPSTTAMATDKDHVICIEREGTAPRWVKSLGRTDAVACTVTFEPSQARRMSEATAQKHAQRLQDLAAKMRAELSVRRAD